VNLRPAAARAPEIVAGHVAHFEASELHEVAGDLEGGVGSPRLGRGARHALAEPVVREHEADVRRQAVDGRALLLDDEIIVRPCRDPAQVCAAIAHELAHHAAKRAKLCLAHPDVWRLTLAILVPPSMMPPGASVGDVAAATGAPWWAVEQRMAQKRAA